MEHTTPPQRLESFDYNDAPDIRRFLFICGLHRCGTTLLERLLTARYEISYLRASVPESEGQHMQSVYAAAWVHGGPGSFAFSKTMRDELAALDDFKACRAALIADWSRFVVGRSQFLLEKSPPNLTKIWWLRQVFPGSRFIIMSREPRAVAAATQKWLQASLPELMLHWNAAYSQALADFRADDCTHIRYEDLMKSPDSELERVAKFLQLTPREKKEPMDDRYTNLRNSNAEYIERHEGAHYGGGIWNDFGYEV